MTNTAQLRKVAEGRQAEMFALEDGKIVRLGRGDDADRQVTWQEFTLRLASAGSVRVPRVYGRTELMGRPGLIMERIEGDDLLTVIGKKPWMVWKVARICAQTHARMHESVAPAETTPLKVSIRSLLDRPDAIPPDIRDFALAELHALPDGDRLCHGDFHAGNILMAGDEPVVIDWPNVTRGDPTADAARTWMIHKFGALPPGAGPVLQLMAKVGRSLLLSTYLREYSRQRPLDMSLMRRWAVVRAADRLAEGLPEERGALHAFIRREMAKR